MRNCGSTSCRYIASAREHGAGFILESPTWRASPDWGTKLGYSAAALDAVNRDAIELMAELRARARDRTHADDRERMRRPARRRLRSRSGDERGEAQAYHPGQIGVFAAAGADMITAITMTNANEAIGVARAAREADMPVAISFTRRDRRPVADRTVAARGDRRGRCGNRPVPRLLHGQLRPPHPFRPRAGRRRRLGRPRARHPRQRFAGAVMRSSTRRPTSTMAIRWSWETSMPPSCAPCPRFASWGAAVERTIGTSLPSDARVRSTLGLLTASRGSRLGDPSRAGHGCALTMSHLASPA